MSSKSLPPPPYSPANEPVETGQKPPTSPGFRTHFGCVTINENDKLRFINFPTDVCAALTAVVEKAWPEGIYPPRRYGQAHEIKMHGYPWRTSYSGKDTSRRLVRCLFEALYDRGWVLQAPIDISNKPGDKDSLIFRHQTPPPPPCEWMAISFDRNDRIKFVEAPPPDVGAALLTTFGSLVSRHEQAPGCWEVKFHGSPWTPHGEEAVATRVLVLRMLETLETFGFSLYASLDQQTGQEGYEADTMYVCRQKDWIPGAPVFHR